MLDLTEMFFSHEEGTVGYQVGELQLTIEARREADEVIGWAKQLGWNGGSTTRPSWGLEFDAAAFQHAVAAVIASDAECWWTAPQWVGYWSFPTRDPMGNTVELSTPDRSGWTVTTPASPPPNA